MKIKEIFKSLIILLPIFLCLLSCKKGGTGGNTTVVAIVTHHGKVISGAKVFIKYGSYNFAGTDTSKYNARQLTGIDGYTYFNSLSKGYYSFYAVGYDSTAKESVTGNAELKIKLKDKGAQLELTVPVVE
jgi:hypothetical protein